MCINKVGNTIEKHKLSPKTFIKATTMYGSMFWLVAERQWQWVFGIATLKSHV